MATEPTSRLALASPAITPLIGGLFAAGLLSALLGVCLALTPRIFGPEHPELAIVRVAGLVISLTGIALVTSGLGGMVFGPVWRNPVAARAGFGTHRVM